MAQQGRVVLVVGPSGAGKDTLIAAARRELASAQEIVFVRRYITRRAAAGGEPHVSVSGAEFAAMQADGAFALHWQAHGLNYGIPVSIAADVEAGRTVVANVSRTVVSTARARFRRVAIAHVTAGAGVRAARLNLRGRESEAEVLGRLGRDGIHTPYGHDVVTIDNGGPLERAVGRFLDLLTSEV